MKVLRPKPTPRVVHFETLRSPGGASAMTTALWSCGTSTTTMECECGVVTLVESLDHAVALAESHASCDAPDARGSEVKT